MITRDIIQGFIDGHKAGGHPKDCVSGCLGQYLKTHHSYPMNDEDVKKVLTDVESYKH